MVLRAIIVGRGPWGNMFEFTVAFTFTILVGFLVLLGCLVRERSCDALLGHW